MDHTYVFPSSSDLKPDVVSMICRCCLSTQRHMNDVKKYSAYFSDLADINVSQSDGLPQWLCWECTALLLKAVRFKRKVNKAQSILYEYVTRCAPFPIDAQDQELAKYASAHLTATPTLNFDNGKGRLGYHKLLQHEKIIKRTELDVLDVPQEAFIEATVKQEAGFSDYEDNITLEEFRVTAKEENVDDELSHFLEGPEDAPEAFLVEKKKAKKRTEKKERIEKTKRKRVSETVSSTENEPRSSIRKPLEIDPTKIKIVSLNPEEQIKQREEESQASLKFPFQCHLCFKGFNFESKLQNHMSKHSPVPDLSSGPSSPETLTASSPDTTGPSSPKAPTRPHREKPIGPHGPIPGPSNSDNQKQSDELFFKSLPILKRDKRSEINHNERICVINLYKYIAVNLRKDIEHSPTYQKIEIVNIISELMGVSVTTIQEILNEYKTTIAVPERLNPAYEVVQNLDGFTLLPINQPTGPLGVPPDFPVPDPTAPSKKIDQELSSPFLKRQRIGLGENEKITSLNMFKYIDESLPFYLNKTNVVDTIADIMGACRTTIYNVLKEYTTTGTVSSPKPRRAKLDIFEKLDEATFASIKDKVYELHLRHKSLSINEVLGAVNDDPALPNFSRSTLYRVLKKLCIWPPK